MASNLQGLLKDVAKRTDNGAGQTCRAMVR